MKLATLQTENGVRPVAVDLQNPQSPAFWDLLKADDSLPRAVSAIIASGETLSKAEAAREKCAEAHWTVSGTLLAPVPRPGKVLCIGLNYRDHALETGSKIPEEPVCFGKFSSTIVGPDAEIRLPAIAKQVDYEAELVVVIGTAGRCIPADRAFDHVAGYMNGHDVSARDWQKGRPGGQWLLGKTPDTFAPCGPWLVTKDEIAEPENLRVQLRLNGQTMQDGNTREFIFGIADVIAHVSQLFTLEPGDVIFTGTPPGVGMARDPQVFLKPGDRVEVEIDGLGVLSNPVVAAD